MGDHARPRRSAQRDVPLVTGPRTINTDDFEPILRETGRLVVNFNVAELALRRIACTFIDRQNERIGHVVLDVARAPRLEEMVRAMVELRVDDEDLKLRLNSALDRFRALREDRSALVHAVWRIPNDATDLKEMSAARPPSRKSSDYSPIPKGSLAALDRAAREAFDVKEELDEILETLQRG